ncbi:hypothetical protein VZT92_003212 [Zoarces viviparus]|uniref:Uncharacterized protein n=1 Tax=Zoarces viviparus TaxID=48416 RepID=A0AAW1G0U1_ZOAVI
MAAATNYLSSEDQFLCSICLDVFTDPVSTPCGHNFCKNCITEHWNTSDRCQCPMCKEGFNTRPDLRINTFISEIVAQFRQSAQQKTSRSEQQESKPGEVPCDVCTGTKLKALKSCLSVQSSNIHHPPPTKDWTKVSVHQSYEPNVVRAVVQLEETLSKKIKKLLEAELKRIQKFAVDVTLDPDTANPVLILSADGKQVRTGKVEQYRPNNPERFSDCSCVLGTQSFSSENFYYEVQVKGKTHWDLGVARESINRKRQITLSPKNGYWTIWLRNGNEYKALAGPLVPLSLKSQPQKVGVFVDYEEGLVSFYDVDAAALIYSFTGCSFKEKLFPYFSPCPNYGGKNAAPLIISPVRIN